MFLTEYAIVLVDDIAVAVTYSTMHLNISVDKSYKLAKKHQISEALDQILERPVMTRMREAGYTRSKRSMLREWAAHNGLYKLGYARERTGSVDMNEDETWLRRLGYFFLSWFCPR